MADKLSQQITDALSRAAADPGGLPLFAGKAEAGLFPATAKPAAQRCLADGLLAVVRSDEKGRTARELYGLSDAGWDHLLAAVNPKQVLEDFVRVLEARQGEVGELLATARRMADGLHGLREAVARVLPQVTHSRIAAPADRLPPATLGDSLRATLAGWAGSAAAGEDCPLPDLYRRLADAPSIGAFHDGLRELHAAGAVYLHPWTGPLYALPEPAYALLVGHGVAYYASLRSAGVRGQEAGVRTDPQLAAACPN